MLNGKKGCLRECTADIVLLMNALRDVNVFQVLQNSCIPNAPISIYWALSYVAEALLRMRISEHLILSFRASSEHGFTGSWLADTRHRTPIPQAIKARREK